MITLRRETDYAIHMLVYLKNSKLDFVSLKTLSVATGISFLFLQKIARKLKQAGLIKAGQGVNGGYGLNKNPKKITLEIIIRVMEGGTDMLPCMCKQTKIRTCANSALRCSLSKKLSKTNNKINQILKNVKLSDL
jgi:Rrf2 family protein